MYETSPIDPKTGRPTRRWWGWFLRVSGFVVRGGYRIPPGYGCGWSRPWDDTFVFMPIPFHWLARAMRWAYWKIAAVSCPSALDRMTGAAWKTGRDHGFREGVSYANASHRNNNRSHER